MTCIRFRAFVTTVANAHPAVVIRQTTPDTVALRRPASYPEVNLACRSAIVREDAIHRIRYLMTYQSPRSILPARHIGVLVWCKRSDIWRHHFALLRAHRADYATAARNGRGSPRSSGLPFTSNEVHQLGVCSYLNHQHLSRAAGSFFGQSWSLPDARALINEGRWMASSVKHDRRLSAAITRYRPAPA